MTKEKWIEHIEVVTGLVRPSFGGNVDTWKSAISTHMACNPGCDDCKSRKATRRANRNRVNREECYKAAGLVKGRTGLGRVIWE